MGGAASQHDNELVVDVLRLAEPAFAVNSAQQIVAWNDGAERLLGLRADEVIGMRCYEALALANGGAPVECARICRNMVIGVRAETAEAPSASDHAVSQTPPPQRSRSRLKVTTISAQTRNGQPRYVHFLHDLRENLADRLLHMASQISAGDSMPRVNGVQASAEPSESGKLRRPATLTQRELEVLRLLGAGHSTDEIARELSITRVTARNHVNKVLDKLGVSSRLQAVVIASQLHLI